MVKRAPEEREDVTMGGQEAPVDSDIIQVDFEFFDIKPIDFHASKNLLKQLFGYDHTFINLSAVSDFILGSAVAGSTVKVDGPESDPYAMLALLDVSANKAQEALSCIIKYLSDRSASANPELKNFFESSLADGSKEHVGLLLNERLINMPVQVIPPMYKMLFDELAQDKKGEFTHYILVSKTYTECTPQLDVDDDDAPRPTKKGKKLKKKKEKNSNEVFYFHPEDEILRQFATLAIDFPYVNQDFNPDANRVFQEAGIKPQGLAMVFTHDALSRLVPTLLQSFQA
ncbi:CDK regulator [Schizosaccharomyces japonicus yFS275]|uniref:Protein BCP1 n=1 Tax=Schizosaccharomyces japonicus (strain yFS275 / FY16936) TaxID=402676 RepID=B6JWH7_SCHJY|nr:CDK regulator [Schizosaccharomyces japonicus yFS275]EEB05728.1 CDK regulator [Schizosaccharomyces japonicus yFS275]